jgi:6-phosphogluconolactonase (cycloisomerase 2 family)
MTNARAGNAIVRYVRASDGALTAAGTYPTGGLGSGDALGESQSSIALSADGTRLFAVNAASNDVSSFAVTSDGLTLIDREPSGGTFPISVAASPTLLSTLNATSSTIAALRISLDGHLTPVSGSSRALSASSVTPEEIAFDPAAPVLVVTERGTNHVDTFPLDANGIVISTNVRPSAGGGPFGFAFTPSGTLVVSEQFGNGAQSGGGVSSYSLDASGALTTISASLANGQPSPCWVAIDPTGRYAYVTNTSGRTLSVFAIAQSGALTLLAASVPTSGAGFDDVVTRDGRYLYVIDGPAATIDGFAIASDGTVAHVSTTSVPAGSLGLASL